MRASTRNKDSKPQAQEVTVTRGFQYATRGWAFAVRPDDGTSAADELRIGDAERESAAKALGEHLSAGRLGWDEYDSRLQTVYAAKTRGELTPLFGDLPALPPGQQPRPGLGTRFVEASGVPLRLVALFLVLFVALLVGSLLDFHAGLFVPVALFFWFGPIRHRHHQHHQSHQRRRQAVPAGATPWEPPRSR
jgi:Domain of unknown function (DUF1707)